MEEQREGLDRSQFPLIYTEGVTEELRERSEADRDLEGADFIVYLCQRYLYEGFCHAYLWFAENKSKKEMEEVGKGMATHGGNVGEIQHQLTRYAKREGWEWPKA